MRLLGRAVLVTLVLLVLAGAVGLYYSNQILGPDTIPAPTGQRVFACTESTVVLSATVKARRSGLWAIEWPGGFGHIGPLVTVDGDRVVTRFRIASGAPPDTTARLAGFVPDADPRTWLGAEFDTARVDARIGPLPAWLIPGSDSTWAIFIHGRAATRAEVLRMVPVYRSLGLPCLLMSYRNHRGAPRVGDGSYRLGATEWLDVEDGVRHALRSGARDVVLVGCSMGGGIVATFLRRSEERVHVRCAVLDAPALDWNAILAMASRARRVPQQVTDIGKSVASLRTGIRWDELDQIRHASEFSTPMLVFHCIDDDTVPVEVSRRFAAARPDLVTLCEVEACGHVESVNVAQEFYADTLAGWLRGHGVGSDAAP